MQLQRLSNVTSGRGISPATIFLSASTNAMTFLCRSGPFAPLTISTILPPCKQIHYHHNKALYSEMFDSFVSDSLTFN